MYIYAHIHIYAHIYIYMYTHMYIHNYPSKALTERSEKFSFSKLSISKLDLANLA